MKSEMISYIDSDQDRNGLLPRMIFFAEQKYRNGLSENRIHYFHVLSIRSCFSFCWKYDTISLSKIRRYSI